VLFGLIWYYACGSDNNQCSSIIFIFPMITLVGIKKVIYVIVHLMTLQVVMFRLHYLDPLYVQILKAILCLV
jgi:hypothetical protein